MSEPTPTLDKPETAFHDAAELIRAGEWQHGLEAADAIVSQGEQPDDAIRLLLAIALVRSGAWTVASITPDLVRAGDPNDLRRLLLTPLIQKKTLDDATTVLGRLIEAFPPALRDRTQRASLYARLGRWDEAIADMDFVAEASPEDDSAQAVRLQYRIQGGRVGEAAELARSIRRLPSDDRTLNFMLLALIREGDRAEAAKFVDRIPRLAVDDPLLAGNMLQALVRAGRLQDAIDLGEWFVSEAVDGPLVRSYLAQAWYRGGPPRDRFSRAIEHLQAGVAQAPDDLRMVSLLGQLLLRTGKTADAIPHLRKSVEQQPDMVQIRALYGRALKEDGQLAEAAEQFAALIEKSPDRGGRWQRYAAGALSQAGRQDEAADLFDAWVAARSEKLPDNFNQGLDDLWGQVDEVSIPKARLDWAWKLRSPDNTLERPEWERRAKWGYLADHYLLDWLECRDAQVEEAMQQFAEELDAVEGFIAEARERSSGKGCVFASAHVGAMYFGPLALELLGVRSRWLASTPSVARTSYAQSLISTSDQTQAQVARGFMDSLKQDYTVVVVVDGAINLAAPRIDFEGQEITFSEFAARTAHRVGSSSAFVAPMWRDNHNLGFVLEHLPMPEDGESADDYALRWRTAYLGHLRTFLGGQPENLRLSGGIWRHIR
jgi:tetratricopeptide (TPR) repeat protein